MFIRYTDTEDRRGFSEEQLDAIEHWNSLSVASMVVTMILTCVVASLKIKWFDVGTHFNVLVEMGES